jgi:KaiC/GvpD/RAD55 family RecA-like ATPase
MSSENVEFPIIKKFLDIGNRSLLIKGDAGTGKKTLSLDLAKNVAKDYDIYFITGNKKAEMLHSWYPWIEPFVPSENIMEISSNVLMSTDSNFLLAELVNRISNTVATVDNPFVSDEEPKKPFFIMDIWDSLTTELTPQMRLHAEKAVTALVDKHNGFIVFLSDNKEQSSLEQLVDGVIQTSKLYVDNFMMREILIKKLMGMEIQISKIPFSFRNGRLSAFSRFSHFNLQHKKFEPIPDSENRFSTGNQSFDDKIGGGFKKGSIIGIEIEPDVDRYAFVPFLLPIVLNFLNHNNSTLLSLSSDQNAEAYLQHISPHIDEEKLLENFRLYCHTFGDTTSKIILDRGNEQNFESAHQKWLNHYKQLKAKQKSVLMQVDYSFIELGYRGNLDQILKAMIENTRTIRHNNDLMIMTSRPGFQTLGVMKSACDIHFRIFDHEGCTFISTDKPKLFYSNIQTDSSSGCPKLQFTDIY